MAKSLVEQMADSGSFKGSAYWMAPEVIRRSPGGGRLERGMHRDRDGEREAPVGGLQRAGPGHIQDRQHQGVTQGSPIALPARLRVCSHVPAARSSREAKLRGVAPAPVHL